MDKAYQKINWENYPSDSTPLNAENLLKTDRAIYTIDDRVISLDTSKANLTELGPLFKSIEYNDTTGIFTFTRYNGSTVTVDTLLDQLAVNFDYDSDSTSEHYQQIIITLEDGTKKYVDLSSFINEYEFTDTDTIDFSVSTAGTVSAIVKEGSILEKHLQPNYLADIKVVQEEVAKDATTADTAKNTAVASASSAQTSAETAQTLVEACTKMLSDIRFRLTVDGILEYNTSNENITFRVNDSTGNLEFQVIN